MKLKEFLGSRMLGIKKIPHGKIDILSMEKINGYNQALQELGEMEIDVLEEKEVYQCVSEVKQVGMVKHYHLGHDWCDLISKALCQKFAISSAETINKKQFGMTCEHGNFINSWCGICSKPERSRITQLEELAVCLSGYFDRPFGELKNIKI